MTKHWLNAPINFAIGTMLHFVFYGLLGFLWNIVIGYQTVAVIYRWRIRKDSYNFLFKDGQKNT